MWSIMKLCSGNDKWMFTRWTTYFNFHLFLFNMVNIMLPIFYYHKCIFAKSWSQYFKYTLSIEYVGKHLILISVSYLLTDDTLFLLISLFAYYTLSGIWERYRISHLLSWYFWVLIRRAISLILLVCVFGKRAFFTNASNCGIFTKLSFLRKSIYWRL